MRIVVRPGPLRLWRHGRLRSWWTRRTCKHREWSPWRYETEDWFEHLAPGERLRRGCWSTCLRCRASRWVE